MKLFNPFTAGTQVAYVGGTHTTSDSNAQNFTLTYTPTAGNWIFIVALSEGNLQIACADNNSHSQALLTNVDDGRGGNAVAVFLTKAITGATSYVVNFGQTVHGACALAEYSPSTATIGNFTTAPGQTTPFSNAQNITGASNLILSAVGVFSTQVTAATITTGTKRQDSGAPTTYVEAILLDNNNSTGNAVAGTATGFASLGVGIASVELVSAPVATNANTIIGGF